MKDPLDIFRRFSTQAKKILTTSQQVAESMQSGIGTEHILISLAITPQTIAYEILKEYAVNLEQVRLVLSLNDLWNHTQPGLTDEAKAMIKVALREAVRFHHEHIEAEHLLLAMTSLRDSRAYQVIARVGVDPDHVRRQLEGILGEASDLKMIIEPDLDFHDGPHSHQHSHDHSPQMIDHHHDESQLGTIADPAEALARAGAGGGRKGKFLDLYTLDLTAQAQQKKLDPVLGRTTEIARTMQILARRTKNNPVLIGDPGVGKTAIAEGLAQRIVDGTVPAPLSGRRILRLDLALLVAGTMYRGQFEERLKRLVDEVRKDQTIILFIDELHTVVGTGSAEGSMDAANILKPALARGELRMIGATTLDDYRKFIEKDAALERRFQTVLVEEPSIDETIHMLEGLKPTYEQFHHVQITQAAIEMAVGLAKRYITDRALPDKAIDVLDEAAAAKQIAQPSKTSQAVLKLQHTLELLTKQKERAIEREAFARAAELRAKELKVREQLAKLMNTTQTEIVPVVDRLDIATVIAQLSRVPRSHLIEDRTVAANDLEDRLQRELIGQHEAVKTVAAAIRRSQARINLPGRPLGSFLFLGPTGVGKTELARILAREVFGNSEAFIKLDMSEFMERHSLARLVGAPPGYVGYDDGGKLTEIVRRHPYALLLLDEVEKAHPEMQNILLQILEDGVLTDAKGRKVNFSNTIIILTSNLGSGLLTQAQAVGFHAHTAGEREEANASYHDLTAKVLETVRDYFQPEFLNRLDGLIVFKPLEPATIARIVDLRLNELIARMADQGYTLDFTPEAKTRLADHGFDQEYGARPIRRLITDWIENRLAELILDTKLVSGDKVTVVATKDAVALRVTSNTLTKRKPTISLTE